MSEKKPRWENELFNTRRVPDDIVCKTCIFRKPGVMLGGEMCNRHTHGDCLMFEPPNFKPREILWEHGQCELYEPDEQDQNAD